ncbi:hypothetical protein G7046_g7395 [Stylonectria norvegica]|nr:hypothetical protein G7046_g7395 [Stylonectria norvegica]
MSASPALPGNTKHTAAARPQRILACVACSQRKIKCERVFPCTNCGRAGIKCVPTAQQSRRRRRLPERDLLAQIRYYEGLLRENNLTFRPLYPEEVKHERGEREAPVLDSLGDAHSDSSSSNNKAVDFFHAIGRLSLDSDEEEDVDYQGADYDHVPYDFHKSPWAQGYDHLLFFGSPTILPLSTLHPEQAHIFRLWQIYLENVDPLLKITHTPTLQGRIVNAIGDLTSIRPAFQALVFSIYCVSVMSLSEDECALFFGSPRDALLSHYHYASLCLYLVSVRAHTDPRSLSSILAVAIRIAKRKKMHDESSYASCDILDAEMRRRLWWSLTLFDHRTCEMSDFQDTSLAPTWDCKPPSSVNDVDLWPEMKTSPTIHEKPTEALFTVVRSELADFVRYTSFHISFINPSLKTIAQPKATRHWPVATEGDDLAPIETAIEEKYLAACDPDNLLHFMTIWTTRSTLARNRLLQYYSRQSTSRVAPTLAHRNVAIAYALRMLECDTKLRSHTRTRGFLWFIDMYPPAIAFNHMLHELRDRPDEYRANEAWAALSANYDARAEPPSADKHRNLAIWIPIVLHVWRLRETRAARQNMPLLEVPRIVSCMRERARQMHLHGEQLAVAGGRMHDFEKAKLQMPMDLGGFATPGLDGCPDLTTQFQMNTESDHFWTTIDWNQIQGDDTTG